MNFRVIAIDISNEHITMETKKIPLQNLFDKSFLIFMNLKT